MNMDNKHLLSALGKRVRRLRMQQNRSLKSLAEQAGLSRRFLVEIEAGRANPSLSKLASLSTAIGISLSQLCDLPLSNKPNDRIGLLGIRGAGKSSIGPKLASMMNADFEELDDTIENTSGMTLREIFETEGREGFARREAEALETWFAKNKKGILALPGSIVNHTSTYDRLLNGCTTIWLSASAETHWERVIAQGDLRPLEGGDKNAMNHLQDLLKNRKELYSRADFICDTTNSSIEDSLAEIETFLTGRAQSSKQQ